MRIIRQTIQNILLFLAHGVIEKYQPKIIGITGTVGKTTTKNAIVTALQASFRVRADSKSLNTEIGFPLAILGMDIPGRSMWRWVWVFVKGVWLLVRTKKDFPEVLILEYGADKPGDISYLLHIARPHIAVLTAISPVHMEFFKTLERVQEEKFSLIMGLRQGGTAIVNIDFPEIASMTKKIKEQIFTYSLNHEATVYASEITQKWGQGVLFHAHHDGSSVPLLIPGVAGNTSLYPVLAALCVGITLGKNLVDMARNFSRFHPQSGRMHYLDGIKKTILIDDSYNSSPVAAKKAIEFLGEYPLSQMVEDHKPERFAVLGGMNELGSYTDLAHEELGKLVVEKKCNWLITVGQKALSIVAAAKEAGMNESHIVSFDTSPEAGKFLQDKMQEGDVLLFKGSQGGIFLEEAIKEVMAEPQRAKEFLVRQGPEWKAIKKKLGMWVD